MWGVSTTFSKSQSGDSRPGGSSMAKQFGDPAPNFAYAHDTDRLSGQLVGRIATPLPPSLLAMRPEQLSLEGQNVPEDVLGDRGGVDAGHGCERNVTARQSR